MEFTSWYLFVVTFCSVIILPGPNSVFVVSQSLKYGFWRSLAAPIGFMSATGLHAIIVFSGIGLIVQKYTFALLVLKWLGVSYLLLLSYKAFTNALQSVDANPKELSKLQMYFSAVLVSLISPKALIASLIIYPMFITPDFPYLQQAVIISLTAMSISFITYISYGMAASKLKTRLTGTLFVNKIAGGLFLSAATILAAKKI